MRVLIVEDDSDFIEALEAIVGGCVSGAQVTLATNRQDASNHIEVDFYDLIILDLNIPADAESNVPDPSHGHAVFTTARVSSSGTPIIVLTGSSAEDFFPALLRQQQQTDVWGAGKLPLLTFHKKHLMDKFPEALQEYVNHFQSLADIELDRSGLYLSFEEDRRFRIFARAHNAARVVIQRVGGGLSDTKVYKVVLSGSTGAVTHNAIAKIGSLQDVASEDQRYARHISRLAPESTPRKIGMYEHGAKVTAGVFYGLATGFDTNAWSNSALDPRKLVESLHSLLAPWAARDEHRMYVRELRQRLLNDDGFNKVVEEYGLDWCSDFENRRVQVKWGCCHGDLHGLNVLCNEAGQPILIDYGDVGPGAACTDPITLELSMFFHPEGPLVDSGWPSVSEAESWGDLEQYLKNCPRPDLIRQCREWARRSAAGNREIGAVAYSYLLRQLKYENTNKERVLALLEGVRTYLSQS